MSNYKIIQLERTKYVQRSHPIARFKKKIIKDDLRKKNAVRKKTK